jgi:hypothetical protein
MAKKRTTTITDSILPDDQADALKKEIGFKLKMAKNYWRPLNTRQDYWSSMYLLLDPIQQMKPIGYRRFVSNEPRTSVDSAVSILTRNDSFWKIDQMQDPLIGMDERRSIGRIEDVLKGLIEDADESFTRRGRMPFWKTAAYYALLRGWIWGKAHITNSALDFKDSPLITTLYDPRTTYPHFDDWGLSFIMIETETNLGNLVMNYPDTFEEMDDLAKLDANSPAVKIEYWSNTRYGRPGVTGVLAIVQPNSGENTMSAQMGAFYENPLSANTDSARWIIHPYFHGYTPSQLPVVGVPVNGLPIETKPVMHPMLASRLEERADLLQVQTQNWMGPGTWQADSGRSILSAVEDQVPQYNELVATIFHHFSLSAFGQWVFQTPTGEIPEFEPGIEAKIALRPEERVQRLDMAPVNSDAFRLMQLLQEEQQKGVLSNVLQAATGFQGTGVLFQQVSNAALNSLEPFVDGMEKFGTAVGRTIISQMQVAAPDLKPFLISATGRSKSYFTLEFDPKTDLDATRKYRPVPVFKPALPDDMAVRINAARFALDPRRPILSLKYVLENILQVDDTQGEIDAMWEDLANQDPVIVLEHVGAALDRMGESDMADRIRGNEFKAKFVEDMQWKQMQAQAGGQGGGGVGGEQQGSMPPEAGGGNNAQQTGQGDEGALQQAGAAILGGMGERGNV